MFFSVYYKNKTAKRRIKNRSVCGGGGFDGVHTNCTTTGVWGEEKVTRFGFGRMENPGYHKRVKQSKSGGVWFEAGNGANCDRFPISHNSANNFTKIYIHFTRLCTNSGSRDQLMVIFVVFRLSGDLKMTRNESIDHQKSWLIKFRSQIIKNDYRVCKRLLSVFS